MAYKGKIITVGIRPAWDVQFFTTGLNWGDHRLVDSYKQEPAGKALNVSKALSWMGYSSVAAGLWGASDFDDMLFGLKPYTHCIDVRFTPIQGATRRNVSIFDTSENKELHLRVPGALAAKAAIKKLSDSLFSIIDSGDICVFAGPLPEENPLSELIVDLVWQCSRRGAYIFLDSSSRTFSKIFSLGCTELVSPNNEELSELSGSKVKTDVESIARAGKKLLKQTSQVLVSLGEEGALLITKEGLWRSRFTGKPKAVQSTVGCGDYLLAGFIAGKYEDDDPAYALQKGLLVATSRAFGLMDDEPWEVEQELEIDTEFFQY
ncbi:6-phosphofructokinase isozyme 2 [Sedimentisphaera cyanobacteriorum]|uniref:6-phosphofructokinase isozyme 2 n=1 Tax=Sedimentisphaera cyanobacteriorum TaxID=1940790 RepID=A0A1Q2HQY3_9BACT|nr:PfkB family carbohydrate kinase [Sedimentisphaera cyanobacteriorum]AQQ09741.1 6-phosphofructokinase isozyme 2 [Sedimentisphaera cyanobacteriorum]